MPRRTRAYRRHHSARVARNWRKTALNLWNYEHYDDPRIDEWLKRTMYFADTRKFCRCCRRDYDPRLEQYREQRHPSAYPYEGY